MTELKTKLAAAAAMVTCCGAAMLVAVGAIAISGAWFAGGVAAIALTCVGLGVWGMVRGRRNLSA